MAETGRMGLPAQGHAPAEELRVSCTRRAAGPTAPTALLAEAWEQFYLDVTRATAAARALAASGDTLEPWGWWHLAFARVRGSEPSAAAPALARAERGFAAAGDTRGLQLVQETEAIRLRREGRSSEALALQESVERGADGTRTAIDLFIAHNSRAITYRELGRVDDALRQFHAAHDAAEASGNPGARITALANLGGCHLDLYNLDDAREMSERAFAAARSAPSPSNLIVIATNLIVLHYAHGEPRRAREMAEFLVRHPEELPPNGLERGRTAIALGHLATGEIEQAIAWLERGTKGPMGDLEGVTFWTWLRTRCALAEGDAAGARALAEATLAERARKGLGDGPFDLMQLHRALADACERLGDAPAALACMRRAQELYEQLVGRSARARHVALQIGFDLARAQRERDLAVDSRRAAEADRQRLADLNAALERQIAENDKLHQQLVEQALRDPLTGLHNRRFLFEAAPGMIERARRQEEPLTVALLDLDHFKLLNDTYGHQAGDTVLKRFAALLTQTVRRSDVVCRHGGEEFVMLMSGLDGADTHAVLERMLEEFQRASGEFAGRRRLPSCSFSAGIAIFPTHGATLEQLLSRADRALYRAKQQGRSRIEQVPGTSFATLP
ncbi:MAG: GGDEF domain-containing protein [Rubrivivax sp.]|nr:GGDEF domain-containing protein [Rubrivivax sp.]